MPGKIRKVKPNQTTSVDEALKQTGEPVHADPAAQSFDEYQCSGDVEIDFPALCNLLEIKYFPTVRIKRLAPTGADKSASWSNRCLLVELENEDPLRAKSLKIFGWKVDDHIIKILQKMLPSLSRLQKIEFSQAGLTDQAVTSLLSSTPLCANLCFLTVEGNRLSEQSYKLLLSGTSSLTHLSLKNNRMGDEGARLIGAALSAVSSTNKKILALNLSFNSIGDEGATHIAQGLRLNRTLVCLSLSNNQIGDAGATQLALMLGRFALTREEAEERTELMEGTSVSEPPPVQQRSPSSTPNRAEPHKVDPAEGRLTFLKLEAEPGEVSSPLLDAHIQQGDGELVTPGNTTLISLNLSGNKITEKSLPVFLKSLQEQRGGGGLLRLPLQRNRFSPGCDDYVKITELMAPRGDKFMKLLSEETNKRRKEAQR